jgi:hypothetical protein
MADSVMGIRRSENGDVDPASEFFTKRFRIKPCLFAQAWNGGSLLARSSRDLRGGPRDAPFLLPAEPAFYLDTRELEMKGT